MSATGSAEELLQQLRAGTIPATGRRAAARGILPLLPSDLLRVQAFLALHDPDGEVRAEAASAVLSRDPQETAALAAERDLATETAEFLASSDRVDPRVLEALIRNPSCPDEQIAALARRARGRVVESLVLNEVRLIRAPQVLEAIESNPTLSASQRDRLAEIRRHFLHGPEPPLDREDEMELGPDTAAEMVQAMRAAQQEEERSPSPLVAREAGAPAEDVLGDAAAGGDAARSDLRSAFQRLLGMTPMQKVRLAYRGSAEERALLVRDPNRIIASSVLKSPRLTDKEVETYVNMRSLSEDVLRTIAAKRDWTRNYAVVLGLVRNPKTPPGAAMTFLSRLTVRDMNLVAGDRNVQEVVRQQARRTFIARTQGRDPKR